MLYYKTGKPKQAYVVQLNMVELANKLSTVKMYIIASMLLVHEVCAALS